MSYTEVIGKDFWSRRLIKIDIYLYLFLSHIISLFIFTISWFNWHNTNEFITRFLSRKKLLPVHGVHFKCQKWQSSGLTEFGLPISKLITCLFTSNVDFGGAIHNVLSSISDYKAKSVYLPVLLNKYIFYSNKK